MYTEEEVNYFLKTTGNSVILDTNVFLLFVVGNISRDYIKKIKRTKSYEKRDFNILINVLNNFKRYIVTPNILTEVSNLLRDEEHHHKTRIFQELTRILSEDAFKERFIESQRVLKDRSVYHFGITDIGLAKFNPPYGIITADGPLCGEFNKRGIPILNFNHLKEVF